MSNPAQPIKCHLDDCDSTNTMACESCGNWVCRDEHGHLDEVSGGWFCGLKPNAASLARAGRYDEVTYCAVYCEDCGAAELAPCDGGCRRNVCLDCLEKRGDELLCHACRTARERK